MNPELLAYWNSLTPQQQAQFGGNMNNFLSWYTNTQGGTAQQQAAPMTAADVRSQIEGGPLYQFASEDYNARNALTGAQYASEMGDNADAYNDLNSAAQDAYGDRSQLIGNEVAAWDAIAQREAQNARDLVASRFGVRGDLGKSTRNIAEIGNNYAQDRALYEGQRRYQAYGDLADARNSNLSNYWSNAANANNRRWQGYGSAYDTYASGRGSAYSDWLNAMNAKSDRGYNAGQLAVNAGQVATNNINSSTQNAADAYSNAALARGNATANMWNNIGSAVGSVGWGKIGNGGYADKPNGSVYSGPVINGMSAYGSYPRIGGWG